MAFRFSILYAEIGTEIFEFMQSILIAVLGGISPDGGKGKVSGMVLSVIIIQVVASGLNILRISSYLTTAVYGLILLAAVAFRSKKFGN